jgi:membrane fusion protein (multidrug efflux system)
VNLIETGNIAFRSRFPNPDKLLRNGETGKVLMTVPLKNALVIPQKQLMKYRIKICFLVDKNSVVHSQEIKIKGEIPDFIYRKWFNR